MENVVIKQDECYKTEVDLWGSVLASLRNEYGVSVFNSWFAPLTFQEIQNNTLKLTAPSKFIKEGILNNYFNKIKQLVMQNDPHVTMIDLRIKSQRATVLKPLTPQAANDQGPIGAHAYSPSGLHAILDPRFTFDNFIVGPSNKLAYAAATEVAEYSRTSPTVLYLYGAVGMGKTHLLQSIAATASAAGQKKRVAYLSSERFMHQYILSLKNNTSLGFKEYLRNIDILLVDDLQFICGKSSTQQEFANTLNALAESGKSVVISSDRSPYQLEFDRRTKSRLAGALIVEINTSDYALRLEILKHKVQALKATVSMEVLEFIAQNVISSIRELEGALHNLLHHTISAGLEINLHNTRNILRDCFLAHETRLTLDQIINVVGSHYGFTASELLTKSREKQYIIPRQVAAFMAKQLTNKSLKEIGYSLGKRDHATVIYSIKKLEERLSTDKSIERDVNKISSILNAK